MIAQQEKSQLIIIDMQEKLASVMPNEIINKMIRRFEIVQRVSLELGIPQVFTEQYPKGLGHTLDKMQPLLNEARYVEKTVFDSTNEPAFEKCLVRTRSQVFLLGMEAHICILQTALSLLKKGKDVFIIEDLVASRNISNKQNALNRLRQAGCIITNTESVVFEWIKSSEHDAFKNISLLIKNID
jgi:isochorismate hydrolase|tara:strand:+ start:1641 stop:2195 length:555 start_codon:yes stop_codon:yes gene_type:complete